MFKLYFPAAAAGKTERGISTYYAGRREGWMYGFGWWRVGIDWPDLGNGPQVEWPDGLLTYMSAAARQRVNVMVSFKGCPERWRTHQRVCGFPDKPGGLEAYAATAGVVANLAPVCAMEIWNEPNSKVGYPIQVNGATVETPAYGCLGDWDPVVYTEMVRAAGKTIRAARPGVQVIAGAVMDGVNETWVEKSLAGLKDWEFDGVSFHHYVNDPVMGMQSLKARLAYYQELARGKPVWVTELSLLRDEKGELQAEFAQAVVESGIERVFWYGDPGWVDGEGKPLYSQIVEADGTKRPGYFAWAQIDRPLGWEEK